MYVTLKRIRVDGRYIPAGYIVPDHIPIPYRMVTTGLVAELPDTLREYSETEHDEPKAASKQPDNDLDEELAAVAEDNGMIAKEEESVDEIERLLDEYDQGRGWFNIPVDGEVKTVRGRDNARALVRDNLVD